MFTKSSLLAIALGVVAIAPANATASALSSQVYTRGSQPTPPRRELPSFHREERTMVGRSMYPMPRRPMRQPFN